MNAYLSSYDILHGWLSYLENNKVAGRIVGRSKNTVLNVVKDMSLLQREIFFCLEAPLKGQAGVDLYLYYQTKDFLEGRCFSGKSGEFYNKFLEQYSALVGPEKYFFLELDTGSGLGNQAALFLDISSQAEQVIEQALLWQREERRKASVLKVLQAAAMLEPLFLGFVYNQKGVPIRLVFKTNVKPQDKRDYSGFRELLTKLGLTTTNKYLLEDLKLLEQVDFINVLLDVDILSDGKISPVICLEPMLMVARLKEQSEMLSSQEYTELIAGLKRLQIVDDRIQQLEKCIFYAPLEQALGNQEYLFSKLMSLRLRYKHGQRLPAKLCLLGCRGR